MLCFWGAPLAQTLGYGEPKPLLFHRVDSWQSPSQSWVTSSGQSWPGWARWLSQGGHEAVPDSVLLPTDRSMSSSLSASQLHTVSMRDPLNRVLGKVGMGPWGRIQPLGHQWEVQATPSFPEVT